MNVESTNVQLWAILACCSRVAECDAAIGLALRACGLPDEEIAARFLSARDTIEERLEGVRLPADDIRTSRVGRCDPRLPVVIQVIYLLFTSGYVIPTRGGAERCVDAIALARSLREMLLERDADLEALLALMFLHHARREGRIDGAGELVLLRDQVRARWDRSLIEQGLAFLDSALSLATRNTALILQARIASVHATAEAEDRTDWAAIVALYDQLNSIAPSPIIALNRAIAVSMVSGPEIALELVDLLRPELGKQYVWHAARADLLARLAREAEAIDHFRIALELAPDAAERRFFTRRIVELRARP